jgi:hypothetical protein
MTDLRHRLPAMILTELGDCAWQIVQGGKHARLLIIGVSIAAVPRGRCHGTKTWFRIRQAVRQVVKHDPCGRNSRIRAAAAHFESKPVVTKAPATTASAPVAPSTLPKLSLRKAAPGPLAAPRTAISKPEASLIARTPSLEAPKAAALTAKKSYTLAEIRALLDWCKLQFPIAFADEVKPLAVGVGTPIARARPESVSYAAIKRAMYFYVNSDPYLQALAREGSRRIDLDGADAGEVRAEHRSHAIKKLAQRVAERRARSQLAEQGGSP